MKELQETVSRPDCFGYYDDGNNECKQCKHSDDCFKKGVI